VPAGLAKLKREVFGAIPAKALARLLSLVRFALLVATRGVARSADRLLADSAAPSAEKTVDSLAL